MAAALLLAVASVFILGSPLHLLHEASESGGRSAAHAADVAASVAAACPPDCAHPEHHHGAHDHPACPACRAFAAPLLAPAPVVLPSPAAAVGVRDDVPRRAIARAHGSPTARGPPAVLRLLVRAS